MQRVKDSHFLFPGLLDAHVHGQGGHDFADIGDAPHTLPLILSALAKSGLSYVMPTFVSLSLPTLQRCLQVLNAYYEEQLKNPCPDVTNIVGVHLEGPFIAKNCAGAHDPSLLQPHINLALFNHIIRAAPSITQWKITLSPDIEGALQFIKESKQLTNDNIFVKVFIGHSNPPFDKIDAAIEAGAVGFTHLGNACQEAIARLACALTEEEATSHVVQWVLKNPRRCPPGIELIVDGAHLSAAFITLIYEKLSDKMMLITDALGPTGLSDGAYQLASLPINKVGDHFYLADTAGKIKKLAGSAVSLSFCIEKFFNLVKPSWQTLYQTIITNPRISSLSPEAIQNLPDENNYVQIHRQTGQLLVSVCNGYVRKQRDTA